MVRPARQGRGLDPAVGRPVIHVMIGPIDALLAVAADEMHPPCMLDGPGHLAARKRQRRALDPAARVCGLWRGGVVDALLFGERRKPNAPGLAQGFVEPAVVLMAALPGGGAGHEGKSAGDEETAMENRHGVFPLPLTQPRSAVPANLFRP